MRATPPRSRRGLRVLVALVWALALAGLGSWALAEGLGPSDAVSSLVRVLQGSAWGPPIFVAVYLARPLILAPASLLTVAGGFLFGAGFGLLLVVVASNASAMVAYGIARWIGPDRLSAPDADGRVAAWSGRVRSRGFQAVIVMRLLYLPFDLVSYLAGAVRVRALPFLAATAIGGIPATLAFVLLGASLTTFDGAAPRLELPVVAASLLVMAAGLVVAEMLRRRQAGPGSGSRP